ncbi:MAG: DUF4381 family protein [Rhodanobacteraceae bacterium]
MNGPVLRDIHLPPAGWWPPGPGWWIVAGLVAAICLLVVASLAWRRRRAPLRAALREIGALAAAFGRDGDAAKLADGASRLLRRIARRIDPAVAARGGGEWRAFLRRYARNDTTRAALDQLVEARFRVAPSFEALALLAALRVWCRRALRERPSSPRNIASTLLRPPSRAKGVHAYSRHADGRTAP